jgi:uncharacterized OsmC-like protein
MNERISGEQLREVQRPIKDRYAEDSGAAQITLEADGALDEDIACSVQTGSALVKAGLHPGTGGDGSLACSGDMLLQALVACAGVTLTSVATNRGIQVSGTIRAEGDLDFKGTMGIGRDAPVGFTAIRLLFDVESEAEPDDLAAVLRATERYCVVYQTLANSPSLSMASS